MINRSGIRIKFEGGPYDGQTAAPTHRDVIQVTHIEPFSVDSRVRDDVPPDRLISPFYTYCRDMQRPWIFTHTA